MKRSARRWLLASACTVLAPAAHGLVAAGDPLPWGQPAQRQNCPDETGYLWLTPPSGDACLRYFGPAGLRDAPVLVVYLTGDRDRSLKIAPEQIENNTQQAQMARSTQMSRRAGVPVVMLARPGTYGSSGDHSRRRRMAEEFAPLYAALDALKRRHGVRRFALWGHSGGATAVAAMLTMGRSDVGCAVLTSSTFAYLERWRMRRGEDENAPSTARELRLANEMYDPLAHIDGMVRDERRTVYLLGDPRDTVTPFALQERFADALRAAGHRAVVREARGAPPTFHDLRGEAGLGQVAECVRALAP